MEPMCVVCHHGAKATDPVGEQENYRLHTDCDTCGSYEIKTNVWEYLKVLKRTEPDFALSPYLSAHLRQATDSGELVMVTMENWRELAQGHLEAPVAEKLRKILEYVAKHTCVGGWLYLENPARLSASADLRDVAELKFILAHLRDRELMWYEQAVPPPPERQKADGSYDHTEEAIQLTVDGWAAVAPIVGGIAGTCFVAMSFDPRLDAAYRDGIVPALESDCGYRAVRVDREPHNENITDRIIAGIRSAQFLVADFTGHRQGVYYEAGFAQGLGRPVIRTCHENDFEKLHFDTRQFLHLKWKTPVDLRTRLADHVLATIGPPPFEKW